MLYPSSTKVITSDGVYTLDSLPDKLVCCDTSTGFVYKPFEFFRYKGTESFPMVRVTLSSGEILVFESDDVVKGFKSIDQELGFIEDVPVRQLDSETYLSLPHSFGEFKIRPEITEVDLYRPCFNLSSPTQLHSSTDIFQSIAAALHIRPHVVFDLVSHESADSEYYRPRIMSHIKSKYGMESIEDFKKFVLSSAVVIPRYWQVNELYVDFILNVLLQVSRTRTVKNGLSQSKLVFNYFKNNPEQLQLSLKLRQILSHYKIAFFERNTDSFVSFTVTSPPVLQHVSEILSNNFLVVLDLPVHLKAYFFEVLQNISKRFTLSYDIAYMLKLSAMHCGKILKITKADYKCTVSVMQDMFDTCLYPDFLVTENKVFVRVIKTEEVRYNNLIYSKNNVLRIM